MNNVTAKWQVILKGKKGYLKDKERDRYWMGFNYVVNPNKGKAKHYTFKQIVEIKRLAKEKGISLKVIKKVDPVPYKGKKDYRIARDLKKRALNRRKEFLKTIRNKMRDLVEYEKRLIDSKKQLEAYCKRLETVNKTLKPLMKHGEKGYSEPKF